ncbi:MAG: hypothetical protein FJW96_05265 [Actinobacteria bacterium]|nr:hypothetical protein [Actinomycetota bacterium]
MVRRLALLVAMLALLLASGATAADSKRVAEMKHVVREWSRMLNAGDNAGLARLFKLPVTMEQAFLAYRLKTKQHVALWHNGLPCSGRIRSITVKGNKATAVFVLGHRPTSRCNTPGGLAAAEFEIVDGKIVHWVQVPVPDPPALPDPAT